MEKTLNYGTQVWIESFAVIFQKLSILKATRFCVQGEKRKIFKSHDAGVDTTVHSYFSEKVISDLIANIFYVIEIEKNLDLHGAGVDIWVHSYSFKVSLF